MNKRGLSGVITTILIIALCIVFIIAVFAVVNTFLKKGAGQISLSKLTVDVKIKSASINYTTNLASVRVKRNIGPGEMVGLKFIFYDNRNSDVIERRVTNFNELAERTFDINLSLEGPDLVIRKVYKVSIAPIIKLESGEESIGNIADTYSGLDKNVSVQTSEEPFICYENLDCGEDYFLEGTKYCGSDSNVYQYKKIYSCLLGFCYNHIEGVLFEDCPALCYNGICIAENISCTNETVATACGVSGLSGFKKCSQDNKNVVQDYKLFECINQQCSMTVTQQIIETCNGTEICFFGECFVPLECTKSSDCDPGKVCVGGYCVPEVPLNTGAIYSIWPFGIGEYFDSANLTAPSNVSYVEKYVSFTDGLEKRCFKVKEHKKPNATVSYSYIRLNESVTGIVAGDKYQILETDYYCGRN